MTAGVTVTNNPGGTTTISAGGKSQTVATNSGLVQIIANQAAASIAKTNTPTSAPANSSGEKIVISSLSTPSYGSGVVAPGYTVNQSTGQVVPINPVQTTRNTSPVVNVSPGGGATIQDVITAGNIASAAAQKDPSILNKVITKTQQDNSNVIYKGNKPTTNVNVGLDTMQASNGLTYKTADVGRYLSSFSVPGSPSETFVKEHAKPEEPVTPQGLRTQGAQINVLNTAGLAFKQSALESKKELPINQPGQNIFSSAGNLIIAATRADSAWLTALGGSTFEKSYYSEAAQRQELGQKGIKVNAYGQPEVNILDSGNYAVKQILPQTVNISSIFTANKTIDMTEFTKPNIAKGAENAKYTGELIINTVPYFTPIAPLKSLVDIGSARTPEEAVFAVVGGLGTAGVIKVFAKSGEALPLFLNTKLGGGVANAVMGAGEEGIQGIKYTSKLSNIVSAGQKITSNYGIPAIGYGMVGFEAMELNAAPTKAQINKQVMEIQNSTGQVWTDATGKVITQEEAIKLIESTPTKEEVIRSGNVAFAGFTLGGMAGGVIGEQLGKPFGKYAFKQTVLQGASPYGQLDAPQKELFKFLMDVGETKIPGGLKPTGEPSITRLAAVKAMSHPQASRTIDILENSTTKYGKGNKLQGSTIFEAFGVDLKRPLGDRDYAQASKDFVTDVYAQAKQQGVAPRGTKSIYEQNQQQGITKYHASFGTRTRISNVENKAEQNVFQQVKDFVTGKSNAPKYKTNVAYEFVNAGSNSDMYTRFYNNQNIGSIFEIPSKSFVKTLAGQDILGLKYNFQEKLYGGYMGGRAKDITDIMEVVRQKPEFGVLPKGAKAPEIPKAPKVEVAPKGKGIFGSFFEARANKANQAKQNDLWDSFLKTKEQTKSNYSPKQQNVIKDFFTERTSSAKENKEKKYYSPNKGYDVISKYIPEVKDYYYPKGTRTSTPTISPTISSLIYGTKPPTPIPPTPTPSITGTPTPSPPTPTPTPTSTPTPYPGSPYYYAPPKRAPKGIPFGGSGGASNGGSANREKRVYYNELEQVLKLIGGSENNRISPAGKGGFRNKGIKGILAMM